MSTKNKTYPLRFPNKTFHVLAVDVWENINQAKAFAQKIAAVINTGDTLLLKGSLGAGKTTFARFLIQTLMQEPVGVVSPTFTWMQCYETFKGPLWHVDLYRLPDAHPCDTQLQGLWQSGITLIEWPERYASFEDVFSAKSLLLEITIDTTSKKRTVTIAGTAEWISRIQKIGL